MTPPGFTRARIARLCTDALRRSGALGVLPTPLDAVLDFAGVRDRVELARIPGRPAIAERLLGAVWFEQRALFVDRRQSEPRRRFTEAHEAVHLLCPWHAAALRLDTAAELFGSLVDGIEAEANFGAGQLIFQGGSFHAEAIECERSLRTPFALAERFGASHHAAAHHYVEGHREPVAMIVAGRWPGADGALPVWRSVESAGFLRRFGRLATCLPGGRLAARDGPGAPLAGAIEEARRSSEPAAATLWLADRGGRRRRLRAEVFNNRHCHLVFVAELACTRDPSATPARVA
jgi:IrrE N-terminal-like domain